MNKLRTAAKASRPGRAHIPRGTESVRCQDKRAHHCHRVGLVRLRQVSRRERSRCQLPNRRKGTGLNLYFL